MPPDGYETITVPAETAAQLDEHAHATGADSRAQALKSLIEGYDPRVTAYVSEVDQGVIDDLATVVASETAEEVERQLR